MDGATDIGTLLADAEIGVWRWEPRAGKVVWDAATRALFGVTAEHEFGGTFEDFVAAVHPDDREQVVATIMAAAASGGRFLVRHRIVRPDRATLWVEGRGFVVLDGGGQMLEGAGIVYDVSAQAEAAAERQELLESVQVAEDATAATRERLRALIEADAVLAATLNLERLAARLADLVVSRHGGVAVVDAVVAGVDPLVLSVARHAAWGREVVTRGDRRQAPNAWRRVRELPPSAVVTASDADWWRFDDERTAELAGAGGHLLSVPLAARGKPVGRLSVRREAAWGDGAIELLEAIAGRAGTALDRAELYEERSRVAAAFRDIVVPPSLEQVPGLDVAVEYRPAHELARLGGDFYDVFPVGDSSWALAVGDVCGKGVGAAVLAGPARHSLRAAALAGSGPAAALRILNDTLLLERSHRFVTAVMATVAADRDGPVVRVASGGHPQPVVVRAGGTVERVAVRGELLGVFDEVRIEEVEVGLQGGDALLLFTDGLGEAVAAGRPFGEQRLSQALAEVAGLPAKAIAESLGVALDAWVGPQGLSDDVVCLVASSTR